MRESVCECVWEGGEGDVLHSKVVSACIYKVSLFIMNTLHHT